VIYELGLTRGMHIYCLHSNEYKYNWHQQFKRRKICTALIKIVVKLKENRRTWTGFICAVRAVKIKNHQKVLISTYYIGCFNSAHLSIT